MILTDTPRRILCATDMTERSAPAMQRAQSLAHRTGARLTMLHVVASKQPDRIARMQANRAFVQLLSDVERIYGPAAGAIDILARRGEVRETIAATANDVGADLIVIAPPRPRRADAILGTTAERLIRTARRPVLVVHGTTSDHYRSVVMATDLSRSALPMARTAVCLAALDGVPSTIVHAIGVGDGMMKSAGLDESTIADFERTTVESARRRLRAFSTEAGLPAESTRVLVSRDRAADAILAVIEQEQPDLLAMGASRWFLLKRLLIGSVADRVIREASCDVLVIPHRPEALRFARMPVARSGRNAPASPA